MKRILSLILASLLLLGLLGCGVQQEEAEGEKIAITAEEAGAILQSLLPRSQALNVIYFGEGLPITEDEALLKEFFDSFGGWLTYTNYYPVDPSCGYTSVAQIKEETLEIFSDTYSEYLFARAFSGISATVEDDSENAYHKTITYAMYLEREGILTVRKDVKENAFTLGRSYDLSSLTITERGENYVDVTVNTELDGRQTHVELRLVLEEDGWRLDSPTY